MLSTSNIESLIAVKRREIEKEKTQLGLSQQPQTDSASENNKENVASPKKQHRVRFSERVLSERNESAPDAPQKNQQPTPSEPHIPPDLERYIRRYLGLPVMLKAGEYSPNNPLVRAVVAGDGAGDALRGLGEYERRRHTLRRIRQQQYREYLDQQAKKKQEAKEQAERERQERERREREREERERQLLEERDGYSPERRRSLPPPELNPQRADNTLTTLATHTKKVDTGVQVDGFSRPLSVAVQTDETELFRLSPSPTLCQLTQAERELSPRSAHAWAAPHAPSAHDEPTPTKPTRTTYSPGLSRYGPQQYGSDTQPRRRSYGDFDERGCLLKKCSGEKQAAELRHSYMPSIFDAEAIRLRNLQAEKEAAERRQFYQQELKNQILEQQRIREERKNREKMLEQAEMRRLEEQLRMLRVAQGHERGKQLALDNLMKENTSEYNKKRSELQREIDQHEHVRAATHPPPDVRTRPAPTARSDALPSKLPFYYPPILHRDNDNNYSQPLHQEKKPYSINIEVSSIFSPNYDVDTYLRRNLNFNKTNDKKLFDKEDLQTPDSHEEKIIKKSPDKVVELDKMNVLVEKALIHECPEEKKHRPIEVKDRLPSNIDKVDSLPIPVLRHSPTSRLHRTEHSSMSDAMKKVDDKWKVPAVQKNILKALPNEQGNNVSILTQLGSIRRQLQLEQLKLDRMLSKHDEP